MGSSAPAGRFSLSGWLQAYRMWACRLQAYRMQAYRMRAYRLRVYSNGIACLSR